VYLEVFLFYVGADLFLLLQSTFFLPLLPKLLIQFDSIFFFILLPEDVLLPGEVLALQVSIHDGSVDGDFPRGEVSPYHRVDVDSLHLLPLAAFLHNLVHLYFYLLL